MIPCEYFTNEIGSNLDTEAKEKCQCIWDKVDNHIMCSGCQCRATIKLALVKEYALYFSKKRLA